jgi:hypothetical protein
MTLAKVIFPPTRGTPLYNKIMNKATLKDRSYLGQGFLPVERFIALYDNKTDKKKSEILNKRAFYIVESVADNFMRTQSKTRFQSRRIFKFGITGTVTGDVKGRLRQYLHYHGMMSDANPAAGIKIHLLLVTNWRPYDGVRGTNSAIHKIELRLKRMLRTGVLRNDADGLTKEERGTERLNITLSSLRAYIDRVRNDKASVDQVTVKRMSARINPTLVLLGQKSVGSIVKVKRRFELPPKGKRTTNWVYKVGERFRVTRFKKYRNEYAIDTFPRASNKGFTTLPPFFLEHFEPI